jgi:UDP-N-acetylmuramate dehydrogenase
MAALNLSDLNLKPDGLQPQRDVPLARYTAARIGGKADWLIEVSSVDELASSASRLWELGAPFIVLGGGSNVLVSDAGVREVVLINRARRVRFEEQAGSPVVWAESGANLGLVARQAAQRGLSGLEWAAGIPGTVGGAVYGNAGAHGGDVAGSLVLAEILHHAGRESWPVERLAYGYRSSLLKREQGKSIVLSALLHLERSTPEAVQVRLDEYVSARRRTQPPGASMGSMFKNPTGDFAGRLIEAAGLKGAHVGEAEISKLHANFFVNHGQAKAGEVYELIRQAREAVVEKFGVQLELEVELIGEWHH